MFDPELDHFATQMEAAFNASRHRPNQAATHPRAGHKHRRPSFIKRLHRNGALTSGILVTLMLLLVLAACGNKNTVEECTDAVLNNLRRGTITIGYPRECDGLSNQELQAVDYRVADRL